VGARTSGKSNGGAARRRAVISLATDRPGYDYRRRLTRLDASLKRAGFGGEFIWSPDLPAGCPDHLDVPFAFKPYCFEAARRAGLESVLWLDSSCIAIRPLDPLFEAIERRGYLLFRNGRHRVGGWASDQALALLGVSREEAMAIDEVNAAAIGLSMTDPTALKFLTEWLAAAQAVVPFRGTTERLMSWKDYRAVKWNQDGRVSADPRVQGHRHDQTVAGVLAHRLDMELVTEGLERYLATTRFLVLRRSTAVVLDRRYTGSGGRLALRARVDKRLGQIAGLVGGSGRRTLRMSRVR
jgi:hypothetical protein